jgi:hypothetical protein
LCKLKFVLNLHSLNSNGIGLWCNGNTTVFGAVFLGSSPSRPTKKTSQFLRGFFMQNCQESFFVIKNSNLERDDGFGCVINQILTKASVEKMGKPRATVRAHSD